MIKYSRTLADNVKTLLIQASLTNYQALTLKKNIIYPKLPFKGV